MMNVAAPKGRPRGESSNVYECDSKKTPKPDELRLELVRLSRVVTSGTKFIRIPDSYKNDFAWKIV